MSVKIISANSIFTENALCLSNRLGVPIEKDFNPEIGDLYIVYGGHDIAPTLYIAQKKKNNQFGYIIMNTEQLNSIHWRNKYYIDLCRSNPVFQYSKHIADQISSKFKINAYSFFTFEFLGFKKEDIEIKEKYDILFIGAKTEKREKIIQDIREKFPDKKLYVDFEYKNTTPLDLTALLYSSEIVLNIPYYEDNALETHRINKAMSCGCKVISIYSSDEDANDYYKDYIYFRSNIITALSKDGFLDQPKKSYEDLIKDRNPKTLMHNSHVIKTIHNKLLSKINIDEKKTD